MNIVDAAISEEGERIVFLQTYSMGDTDEGEPYEKLIVVDGTGRELFKFPDARGKYRLRERISISPNGRYVAVNGHIEYGEDITLFFDLKNMTSWQTEEVYDVIKITSNGLAELGYMDASKGIFSLELKKYLGE